MKRIRHKSLAVMAIMCTLALGCSRSSEDAGGTRSVQEVLSDASTTTSVKLALAFERGVRAMDINVDTDRGTVTLNGEVTSEAERQLAVRVAEDVGGVREVVNRIQVRG